MTSLLGHHIERLIGDRLMISQRCKDHLEEVNETALQHLWHSLVVAIKLQLLVPVVIMHAIAPRFFTTTASKVMKDILANR